MVDRVSFNIRNICLRILVVLILGIIIWQFISYLSDILTDEEYSLLNHFLTAVATATLTFILIQAALKIDKVSWKQLGQGTLKKNIFSFFLGLLIWVIPAFIGTIISLMFGLVEIKIHSDLNYLLFSIFILFIIVFLIEALPEEFIFRGYIYRYLNALFPHWITVILQTLLFSLFAYFIGAMYSIEQIQFLPAFAIILGLVRAISGNVWTSIGFHVAIMTAFQILSPLHNHFDVSGLMTLKFFAFILLPSVVGATVLSFIYSNHKWRNKEPI
ncbi:CPBP family intramembrane glutamic endopeptidase [Pseudogracilibacillus auburnensis]|uniref:CPBP family intramembrane glutamic endopeptidase n=1 Tax=Pseudogracilibacillus auburnensis TaxID=1494959 RepID=UPI001A95A621|nr:type II CAAX endopeptidase family protein [Pseudogracilibacillus auburnensis]MBO1005057.1 CPBP family intramembrane metalloprotease [Pseudogracilibacillus auburnensis]